MIVNILSQIPMLSAAYPFYYVILDCGGYFSFADMNVIVERECDVDGGEDEEDKGSCRE